jgi:hypothetical protein
MFTYRGADRRGTGGTGVTNDPTELAEKLFRQRWRWLVIKDKAGAVVGAIERHPDRPHNRTWWAIQPLAE